MTDSIRIRNASIRRTRTGSVAALALTVLALNQAYADVVVIVSSKSTKTTMTTEEISQIYLGKEGGMKPIENTANSNARSQFYAKVTGRDESQVKALWSRLVFTGKASPPKALSSNADVVKAVASDPNAIGYVDESAVDSSVKVVFKVPK